LSSWNSGRTRSLLVALVAGWGVAFAAPRDFTVGTFVDDAQYAVLAKAIRAHGTYRVLNLPGAPVETKYPPGWPAVLAAAWSPERPDTANLDRLRAVNLALLGPVTALVALAGVAAFGLAPPLAAALAVAGVAAPVFLRFWTIPMSEPLCVALVAAGLVVAARGRSLGAVLFLVGATYVRTLAAPFLVAVLILTWRQVGRRQAAVAAGVAAGLLLPWALFLALHASAVPPALLGVYGSYGQWYSASLRADWATVLLRVPAQNGLLLLTALGEGVAGWRWLPAHVLAIVGVSMTALLWRGRKSSPTALAGLALYALVVLLWPFAQAGRFVGGVWPLVLLALAAGLPGRRSRFGLAALALAVSAVAFVRGEGVSAHRRASAATVPLLETVRQVIPRDSLIAASDPALYYLVLGNPTVPNERMRSYRWYRLGFWATSWGLGDDLWAIVRRYRPAYLVVERRGAEGRYAVGSLARQCPGVLREVWRSNGGEFVFAVAPDRPCAPVATVH